MELKLAMLIADHKKEVREIQRKTFILCSRTDVEVRK